MVRTIIFRKISSFYSNNIAQSTGDLNSFNTSGVFMKKVWATGNMIVQETSLFSGLFTVKRRSSADSGSTWSSWA